jgi:hypothetical protein
MNLIEDVFIMENMQILNEGRGTGPMKIRGCFQRADEENNNKRIYPKALLQREMDKLSDAITERRLMGELDHPQHDSVKLNNVSHLITKLEMNGNEVIGEAEILNTPAGQVVKALIEGGVKVGISSRGLGTLSEGADGKRYVNEDFKLVTWDMVADPSTRGAYPGLTESTEINRIIEDVLPRANKVENFKVLLREEFDRIDEKKKKKKKKKKSRKAARDYDGDGKVESGTEEWKGSRDKAIRRAMSGREEDEKNNTSTDDDEPPKSTDELLARREAERKKREREAAKIVRRAREIGRKRRGNQENSSTDLNLHGLLHSIKEDDAEDAKRDYNAEKLRLGKGKKVGAPEIKRYPDTRTGPPKPKKTKGSDEDDTTPEKQNSSTDLNLHGLLHSIKEMRDKTPADQKVTLDNARKKAFQAAHRGEGRRSKAEINAAARRRENQRGKG